MNLGKDISDFQQLSIGNNEVYSLFDVTNGHLLWIKPSGLILTYDIVADSENSNDATMSKAYIYRIFVSDKTKAVFVNWGDGSSQKIDFDASNNYTVPVEHQYAKSGTYVVSVACNNIVSFNITNGETSYSKSLVEAKVVASSISSVSDSCFMNAVNLSSFDFANTNITSVGTIDGNRSSNGAFENTGVALSSLADSKLEVIGNAAFRQIDYYGDVELPSTVRKIGSFAFYYSSISSITFNEGIESYGKSTFRNSANLQQVNLPNDITAIPTEFLVGTSKLLSIELPASVKTIGGSAFGNGISSGRYYAAIEYIKCNCTIDNIPSKDTMAKSTEDANENTKTYIIFDCTDGKTIFSKIYKRFYSGCLSVQLKDDSVFTYDFADANEKLTLFPVLKYRGIDAQHTVAWPFSEDEQVSDYNNIVKVIDTTDALSGVNAYSFVGCGALEEVDVSSIQDIQQNAFANCSSLTNANYPCLTSIDYKGFKGCQSLSSVILSTLGYLGEEAFYNCISLLSIDLGNVQDVLEGAFRECSSLAVVKSPYVSSAYDYAFANCISLSSIDLSSLVSVCNNCFQNCSSLTSICLSNVTDIGKNAFDSCTLLSSVDIAKVSAIGDYAFENCTSLSSAQLRDLSHVSNNCFENCTNLMSIDLGNASDIRDYSFNNCQALEKVDSNCISSIGSYAFANCSSLTMLNDSNLSSIGSYGFTNCINLSSISLSNLSTISDGILQNCINVSAIQISDSVGIGQYAFENCISLSSVDAINAISIGQRAFYKCYSLSTIATSKLSSIGNEAFSRCSNLISIDLNDISSVSQQCFYNCTSLSNVECANLQNAQQYSFYNCNSLSALSFKNTLQKNVFGQDIEFGEFVGDLDFYTFNNSHISTNLYLKDAEQIYCGRGSGAVYKGPQSNFMKYIYAPTVKRIAAEYYRGTKSWLLGDRFTMTTAPLIYLGIPNADVLYLEHGFRGYDSKRRYTVISIDFSERTNDTVPTVTTGFFDGLQNKGCKILVPERLFGKWCIADVWTSHAGTISFSNSNITSISDQKEDLFNDIVESDLTCTYIDGNWMCNDQKVEDVYGTFEYAEGYVPSENDEVVLSYTSDLIYKV